MAVFDELFASLYEPLPDKQRYLERIGYNSAVTHDKKTLDAIILAHQRSVPFENLDIFDSEAPISLGIRDLYDKIVLRRRGGYCFELNAALMALLQSLGFDCFAVGVRVVWNFDCVMPLSHRATIVTIDGVRYFCDVGFGGPSPQGSVMLDYNGEQFSGGNSFVFDKTSAGTVISRLVDGHKEQLLQFSETPFDPVDFLALNEYQSRAKFSMFRQARLLNLVTETGCVTLSGNVLRIHDNGAVEEQVLETGEELRAAIHKYFGISVSFPLKIG